MFLKKTPCVHPENFDFLPLAWAIGLLAQLVERLNGIEEVSGSRPLGSTI